MPIIQNPSSVGGAGTAMSAVTAQSNQNVQQLLALTQLQDQRRARAAELDLRQRAFAAELDQTDDLMQMRLRAEDRNRKMDEVQLRQMERDNEARDRAFAFESSAKLRDQDRLDQITDAQLAADEAQTARVALSDTLAHGGMASKVSQALDGAYPISAEGLLSMLSDAEREMGPDAARALAEDMDRLTGGDYTTISAAGLPAELNADKRLPILFAATGEKLYAARQQRRAQDRAGEVTRTVGALAKRIEATGDKGMLEDFASSIQLLMPEEGSSDTSFLDYVDKDFRDDIQAWENKVSLFETKASVRGQLDVKRGAVSFEKLAEPVGMGASSKTLGELLGKAMQDIEAAESPREVWGAYAAVLPLIDPSAKMAHEFGVKQGIAAGGGVQRSGVQASAQFGMGQALPSPDEQELYYEAARDEGISLVEDIEPGSEDEARLIRAIDRLRNRRQRPLSTAAGRRKAVMDLIGPPNEYEQRRNAAKNQRDRGVR